MQFMNATPTTVLFIEPRSVVPRYNMVLLGALIERISLSWSTSVVVVQRGLETSRAFSVRSQSKIRNLLQSIDGLIVIQLPNSKSKQTQFSPFRIQT